jgi:hypothetical protein
VDRDIVDLAFLGVQQDGAAISAGEIDRVIACVEDRRGGDNGNGLEADFAMFGHRTLPGSQAGARSVSQPSDAWRRAVVGGDIIVRLYLTGGNQMSDSGHYDLDMATSD